MMRAPVWAGRFYPAEAKALRREVESRLMHAEPPFQAMAVISPHAGYYFSGAVAGAVFSAVLLPRRFIILCPNHTGAGPPLALYPAGEWRTPLGPAPIDGELNRRLLEECPDLREDMEAHAEEHSLEVQLPFIQAQVPAFSFSGICVGASQAGILDELGRGLARVIQSVEDPVLIVVSSDMTHYESAEFAWRQDQLAIDRIAAMDPEGLHRTVREHRITMCGFAPAVAALIACRDLGARAGRLIKYANSGDASGDYHSVVGYAGLAIT